MDKINRNSVNGKSIPDSNICLYRNICRFKWDYLIGVTFVLLTLFGILIKFLLSMQRSLTSDDVFHGMLAREFWVSSDYFLKDFFFFAADPDIFTGAPIFFFTQVISGFSPESLRFTSFLIFLAIIVVFSIIVKCITNDNYSVLLFASLTAVGTPASSIDSIVPKSHIVTILAISIFLYLIFIKKWVKGKYLFTSMFILALLVISDSLVLIWVTIPFFLMFFLVPENNHLLTKSLMTACIFVSGFCFVIKNFIPTWFIFFVRPPAGMVNGWNSHLDGIAQSFISLFLPVLTIPVGTGLFFLLILFFAFLVFFILFRLKWNSDLLISGTIAESNMIWYSVFCIIFTLFAVSLLAFETAVRYLSIIPVLVYCSIAIWYGNSQHYKKTILIFFIIFLIFCLAITCQYTINLPSPNTDEQKLISFISDHNLSPAFADYWDASVTTYISGETVIIRPIKFENGIVRPWLFVSSKKWYSKNLSDNNPFILITRSNNGFGGNLTKIPIYYPPDKSYKVSPYTISVYYNPQKIPFGMGEYSQVNALYRYIGNM